MRGLIYRVLIALWVMTAPVYAQTEEPAVDAPNYIINLISGRPSQDRRTLIVEFGVTNIGGDSDLTTRAELLTFNETGESIVVASTEVRALTGNNDREVITLTTDASRFVPGVRQQFRIQIASLPGQPAITSDIESFAIEIPLDTPTTQPVGDGVITIPGINLSIDLNNREQVLLLIGIVAAGLLLLMLLYVLLRLLTKRSPDFKTIWQPPYATVTPLDPYSTAGIRQSWQPLAQNNLIVSAPTPGTYQIVKLLLGMDGRYLSGWQLVAMRLIQYDQYGRVSRTETLANSRMVRTLNRLIDRSGTIPRERLLRRVTPISRRLVKQFRKKITQRSAMLPIAIDLRFKGIHGEVNILFELYKWETGYWQLVDRWQPEMMIVGKSLNESYTYSIYGQTGGESQRDFHQRIAADLARLLVEMIGPKPPEVQPSVPASIPSPPPTGTTPQAPVSEEGVG